MSVQRIIVEFGWTQWKMITATIFFLFSATYIEAAPYVLEIKKEDINKEVLGFDEIAELSQGSLKKVDGLFFLHSSLVISSEIPLRLSQKLFVGDSDLTIDCPKIVFDNLVINSFESFKNQDTPKVSGNLLFLNTRKNSAGEEVRMQLVGNFEATLRGLGDKNGGIIQLPANAEFDLNIEYDLRSGDSGGENGALIYSLLGTEINREYAYAYEPEGAQSENIAIKRLIEEKNLF